MSMPRICSSCGPTKARFYKNHSKCVPCTSTARKARYARDPSSALKRAQEVRDEKRRVVNEAKSKPCADCGKAFAPICMDFDHRGNKTDNVATMVAHNVKLETILAEIAKCDVVCACCHRTRTARRLEEN